MSRTHGRKNSLGNINIADGSADEPNSKIRYLPLRFVSIVVLFLDEKFTEGERTEANRYRPGEEKQHE